MDDLFGLNDNPIDRFINRFGTKHGHLEMAYHAALPLALTPDLLYLIWANFRSDAEGQPLNMQWVTVADLILSPLCREIRHETYVMETAVRQELLNRMAEDERFGPEYILRLGQFIQHYASQYIQSDIPSLRQFAQAQVWAAQAYTEPDRLLENLAGQYSQQPGEAETVRLADLLEIFSEPLNLDWVPTKVDTLVNFDRLQTFGEGLAKFDRGYQQDAIRQLRRLLGPSRELHIGSVPLPVRSEVAQLLSQQEDKTYTYRIKIEDETTVVVEQIDTGGTTLSMQMGQLALPEENIEIEVPESYAIDRKELEHRLIENFSRDEVNELISDLGLEQDQFLTFRTKSSLIRDLIRYFHRRDTLDELLQACHRSKPSVDWTDITDIVENYAPTSAMIFAEMLNNIESGHSSLEQLRLLGEQLFNILFDDTLRVDFLIFLEKAINENAFVRIELEIDNNFLQDVTLLPWESLCLPEGTGFGTNWLAAAPELMLNRLPSETIPETYFLPYGEPIRIALIVGPQAHDDSPLLYDSIWEAYEILANRAPANFTLLPLLIKPTNEQFASLMAQQPHVVHLIIHAQQFETTGEIALIPARDGKKQDSAYLWLDGKELASEINQYDPTLVILQSDESAQPQMLKGLKDVAAVLAEKHASNVVCWQFPVENTVVARFIHTVFPAFAQGIPLDEAIQNGRRALLRDENPLAFAAPSLFSNTIVRRRTANEPVPRTLPISLGVALAGSDVTTVLEKGEVLPVKSEPLTLVSTGQSYHLGLGFIAVQLFQGEMVFGRDNLLLADVVIDDPDVYSGEIEIQATVSVNADSSIQFQVAHADSGFSREITVSLRDDALIGQPQIQDVAEIINWQLQGVTENYHLATLTAVSDWLNTTDADRVMVITGERSSGKTTVASLLARYFRGDSQPPNNLHALAPISTSAVYFCQPSRPETLHPRSFILSIATQWASRDSSFAYLQSIIDNHEAYELDELVTQLLIKPFSEIDERIYPGSIVFLVDDLDAALQYSGETNVMDVILQMIDANLGLRFLLTSQMQTAVRDKLAHVASQYLFVRPTKDAHGQMRILLIEVDEDAYIPIIHELEEKFYHVRLATSYAEAKIALETEHFHLMITEARLVDDEANTDGLKLLEDVEALHLRGVMPTIVMTAHPDFILRAWDLKADRLIIKEAGYLRKLVNTIKELEEEKIRINFQLEYVSNSLNVLEEVAEDVNWSMAERPSTKLLAPQVRDLFGRLFVDARNLFVSKLKPGLTGAAIVHVIPNWNEGRGRAYVAKVGRKDKVETERRNYKANIEMHLTGNSIAQADVRYTRHLGVLLYTFAESQGVALKEFDEFYLRSEPNKIIDSLKALFNQTYHYWFDNPERTLTDVPSLYYEAFQLDRKKLIGHIQIVLPELNPDAEMIQFTPGEKPVLNPIAWLDRHQTECVFQVHKCITHGDLTGRNIMVDEAGKCWLIDFYRTYKSHNLRDFVILETDIKYRLMSLLSLTDFLHLEEALLEAGRKGQLPILPPSFSRDARKAAQVIHALRQMALKYASGFNTKTEEVRKEYLLSQLMGTLNVVRLRHISENRKLQAMHSAVMMCEELDMLAGRPSANRVVDMYREPVPVSQATFAEDSSFFAPALMLATAQQRFLAENVAKGNVILFIGTAVPHNDDWPNNQELALQLMKEVDILASSSDRPTKLFALYLNRTSSRLRLIQKHLDYFAPEKRPSMYLTTAKLPWKAVYTTNQHTYLEQAYEEEGISYTIQLQANEMKVADATMPIHKLFGSLNIKEDEITPYMLPLTESDYRQLQTVKRITELWQQLATAVQNGTFLLMLYPSEDELMSAYQYCQPATASGLIWMAGANISEEEQDVYRNLDFRVFPDAPGQLLKVLFTLTNYGGENFSDLPPVPA